MEYTFKFPAKCNIRSITIRETDGADETKAAEAKEALGKAGSFMEELIKLSIVAVDDEPVKAPFGEMEKWNSRTRSLVMAAFKSVNGFLEQEAADFLSSAAPSTSS